MSASSYRVAVIEPSPIVQSGLQTMIDAIPEFEVVGMLSDMNRVEERLAVLRADVVIVNPSIVDFHRRGSIKNHFADMVIVALLYSYVDSDILRQFQGVIDVYDDQPKISCTLQAAVTQINGDENSADCSDELSDREREILVAVAKGMMNKEIANLYNISIHTVMSHRKNISRKTGIKSVSGFVVYALFNNLIEQSDIHH